DDHGRADAARLRDDSRHSARLGNSREHRPTGGLGGSDRLVLPDRVAYESASVAATDLPPPDADGIEHQRPDHDRRRLLTVLPADALHAGGPALLGAQDRGRLHCFDTDDDRLLGCLTRTGDEARSQAGAARRARALDRSAGALRTTAG